MGPDNRGGLLTKSTNGKENLSRPQHPFTKIKKLRTMGIVIYQFFLLTWKREHRRYLLVKQGAIVLTEVYSVGKEAGKMSRWSYVMCLGILPMNEESENRLLWRSQTLCCEWIVNGLTVNTIVSWGKVVSGVLLCEKWGILQGSCK